MIVEKFPKRPRVVSEAQLFPYLKVDSNKTLFNQRKLEQSQFSNEKYNQLKFQGKFHFYLILWSTIFINSHNF